MQPSQENIEKNDSLFESPDIELFESGKKWAWLHPGGGHTKLKDVYKNSFGTFQDRAVPYFKTDFIHQCFLLSYIIFSYINLFKKGKAVMKKLEYD